MAGPLFASPAPGQYCVQWSVRAENWCCRLCKKQATADHMNSNVHLDRLWNWGDIAYYGNDEDPDGYDDGRLARALQQITEERPQRLKGLEGAAG